MAVNRGNASCEVLFQKLEEGQKELRRSLRILKKSSGSREVGYGGGNSRRMHRMDKDPLRCVENVPRKRARTVQLSPDSTPPESPTVPAIKHSKVLRRLSSTPKSSKVPPVDLSLEEAVFSRGSDQEEQSTESVTPTARKEYAATQQRRSETSLRSGKAGLSSGNQTENLEPGRLASAKNKKKRGLTVSFLQENNPCESDHRRTPCRRSQDVAGTLARSRDLGSHLIESLNSSRFGVLERRHSQLRKTHQFPRKYRGDDPGLGYDWIAGLLDSDSYLAEHDDDEYFEEMKEFRLVNRSECIRPNEAYLPGKEDPQPSDQHACEAWESVRGSGVTTCVSSYVLNDRLIPVPVHCPEPGLECPVCEGRHKEDAPPTGYIRVSVPRLTLQASQRPRLHRRRSFDITDSMGLSQHCQAGWEVARPFSIPAQPPIDLKSSLITGGGALGGERLVEGSRKRSRELLNQSHLVEYNLRSRTAKRFRVK